MMEAPKDLDGFLHSLLERRRLANATNPAIDDDARVFIERIINAMTSGSKGVFAVMHPDERMQYVLLNTGRAGAVGLLARILQRTAETLEADGD